MRLTKDLGHGIYTVGDKLIDGYTMFGEPISKLGQLEDILEKYNIENNDELEVLCKYAKDVRDWMSIYKEKIFEIKRIEEELGIDLITLFDSKYTGNDFEMELVEDDKTIFFDGDSFFGRYSADEFLKLIKNMLSMYKQLIKLGH